ncbi:COMM DOMAIN-CONTAINING PROTEIN-RELATED [Salix purpurea]|uniref:COMM DOMAIN-CONTAINING PROTEIN-RELATED n=1 Tax=Salix purpurea TaxID=77065 RepID=A0A9Q0WA62_SALPP|nr:COMM DOMAIN-CONTAINING PROTEIN-RELATED [Salix purpurea]
MEDGDSLYLQLHKLSSVATKEEDVEHILTSLWKTRGTGLPSQLKSRFQSLLNLPSLSQLDPVLACLRSIIRKCVHENLSSDDLLKLFPPDLPLDLQTTLITLLHKYQIQWKQDDLATTEQHSLPRTSDFRVTGPPSFTAEVPTQLWPRQDDANGRFNHNDLGGSTSIITETAAPFSVQHHVTPLDNMANVPHLKSMTWTAENCNPSSANRVAIVTLKLQDYSKTSSGETEVKFQLSRDTVEAMLRSMTYINEQLSSRVGTTSGPAQKKQKQ